MSETRSSCRSRLYLAAPLFSAAERHFNERLANLLAPHFELYVPQRDGGLLAEMLHGGVPRTEAAQRIFAWDLRALQGCDLVLIVLDGRAMDEGAVFELGYAYAIGKLCYGLQTDTRRLLPSGNNPMVDQALAYVFRDCDELEAWARRGAMVRVHT